MATARPQRAPHAGGSVLRWLQTAHAACFASDRFDGLLTPVLFGFAALCFGYAVELNNGAYSLEALAFVTAGLIASALAVLAPRMAPSRSRTVAVAVGALGVGTVLQIALMLVSLPGIYMRTPFWGDIKVRFALVLGAFLAGVAVAGGRQTTHLVVPLLCGIHFLLAIWMIDASPQPHIDVYVWHTTAFHALATHRNPYVVTNPNIYGSTRWYAPGAATADRVLFGYPYPPLSLMVGWLGARFGDYRYANAVATTLAGALMAYSRPSRLATTAAAVFWFSPRLLFVIEQGWTEPQVIFLFAATVFAACRSPRLLPLALGFLFAAKQYTILFAPFAFLLLPRPTLRGYAVLVVEAAAIATAITLPWALWNWRAFFGAVIALQFKQPFRPDALSYLAWRAANGAPTLPLSMNLLVFVPTAAAALVRAARTPAGFSGACALGLIVFVAFAKQAFCNYYMLVIGLLCIATATALIEPPSAADTASRRTA